MDIATAPAPSNAGFVNDWWAGRAAAQRGRALPAGCSAQFASGYRSGLSTRPRVVALTR